MTPEQHKQRHVELHRSLDELVADFIHHTPHLPSTTSITTLIKWSYSQTLNPTDPKPELEK